MRTNRRPGSVNTNWGNKVSICKFRHRAEPLNTNWGRGPLNTNWGPGPVNTNLGPGPVNTNWGPGPGLGAGKYEHPSVFDNVSASI